MIRLHLTKPVLKFWRVKLFGELTEGADMRYYFIGVKRTPMQETRRDEPTGNMVWYTKFRIDRVSISLGFVLIKWYNRAYLV